MAIDDEDFLKTVVSDTLGDVQAEGDKDVRFNVDGAGEVDMVPVQPIGDWRKHEHLVSGAASDFQADRFAQEQIDVQRQVFAMLFGRCRGQDDQLLGGDRFVHLGPGQTVVAVLASRVRRHAISPVHGTGQHYHPDN